MDLKKESIVFKRFQHFTGLLMRRRMLDYSSLFQDLNEAAILQWVCFGNVKYDKDKMNADPTNLEPFAF